MSDKNKASNAATNAVADETLREGIKMAERLQEWEDHQLGCKYLPQLSKFLQRMETADLMPDNYYLSGLLEWVKSSCNAWTYEEYEKYPESARRKTDWASYLSRVWGPEKRGGIPAFVKIADYIIGMYEFLSNRLEVEIMRISEQYGTITKETPSTDEQRLKAVAELMYGFLPLAYAVRALKEASIEDCGTYLALASNKCANICDIPRIHQIKAYIDEEKNRLRIG